MKKSGGSLIIRLIDVVLLLLLGFLLISDIVHKSQIKLPGPTGTSRKQAQEQKIQNIHINIVDEDTTIAGIDPEKEYSLIRLAQLHCYYLVQEDDKIYHIRDLEKLEKHLILAQAAYDSISVIIDPRPNSIVQGTINLIDVCRKYGFKRRFQYSEDYD
jgi:biopolymer transport protein ExbD